MQGRDLARKLTEKLLDDRPNCEGQASVIQISGERIEWGSLL